MHVTTIHSPACSSQLQFQIAMMSLLDVAVALEDPFDEAALDGLSCFEILDQMAAVGVCVTWWRRCDTRCV
jgi:hypothetical protein